MNAIGQPIRYASADDWARFLAPVSAAVKNPPDRRDFMARCAACADALAIRAEWLTDLRRRDAMAAFAFWPSVHEIGAVFDADKRHAAHMARFHDTAGRLPPPEPRRPLTDAEKNANRAKVAQLKADLAQAAGQAPDQRPTPRYLRPDHLAAARAALPTHLRPGQPMVPSE